MKTKINPELCIPTNHLLLVEVIEIEQEDRTTGGIFKNPQRLKQERESFLVVAKVIGGEVQDPSKGEVLKGTKTQAFPNDLIIVNKESLEPFNIPNDHPEPLYFVSKHNILAYYEGILEEERGEEGE